MVDAREIKDFFKILNENKLTYVLIKNDEDRIPYKVNDGDDIDLLIHPDDYNNLIKILELNGYNRLSGEAKKYFFLYKMRDDIFVEKNGVFFHIYDKLSCVSFTNMGRSKIPLDQYIQNLIWKDKRWDCNNNWWIMDDRIILLYLIVRSIFDKKEFRKRYILEIEKREDIFDDDEFIKMVKKVFFKFSTVLIEMLKEHKYEEIHLKYQCFADY